MTTYTACTDCGGLLNIVDGGDHHDPGCTPRRTAMQTLCDQWIAAVLAGNAALEATLLAQIEELDRRPPRLLDAALVYASWGWPVFPLRPQSKVPATRHGFKDATTDLDRVRAWWTRHPDNNIGLPTGHAFDVIDIDVPVGPISYTQLLADGDVPDVHGQVATSSGGLHLYIEATGDRNGAGIMPGIDYRGAGGYVVAPPSTLGARGRSWSWITKPSPVLTGALTGQAVS